MKVSIVVPVYNVEKFVAKCIESIINQTYKNLEIILVDDGSTDSSLKICKYYEKKDSRIIVIHQENIGVSEARNTGLDKVTGKYLAFVDADDYICENYIEELLNAIIKNKTKISQCGINLVLYGKIVSQIKYSGYEVKKGRDILYDLLKYNFLQNEVIWNKLYDVNIFKKLRFAKGKLHEDDFINYKLYYYQDNISIVPLYLYNYRQEGKSITSDFYVKRLDAIEGLEERIKFFEDNHEEMYRKYAINYYLKYLKNTYFKVKEYINDNESICELILNKYKYYYKLSSFNIRKSFFLHFPDIYYKFKKRIYKIKNKKI